MTKLKGGCGPSRDGSPRRGYPLRAGYEHIRKLRKQCHFLSRESNPGPLEILTLQWPLHHCIEWLLFINMSGTLLLLLYVYNGWNLCFRCNNVTFVNSVIIWLWFHNVSEWNYWSAQSKLSENSFATVGQSRKFFIAATACVENKQMLPKWPCHC